MAWIQIELTAEKENGDGYFYSSLDLPATKMQIENAKQQARYMEHVNLYRDISVYESDGINFDNVRLDTTSIEELNFLAKRLNSLERHEQIAYDAVTEKYFGKEGKELPSVKDLINLTYGLDAVPLVPDITDLEELGRFAVENSFITSSRWIAMKDTLSTASTLPPMATKIHKYMTESIFLRQRILKMRFSDFLWQKLPKRIPAKC